MFGHNMTWPNPNLAPIETPPFVALRIHPRDDRHRDGPEDQRVRQALNAAGQPISGLYACGNDQASPFQGFLPRRRIDTGARDRGRLPCRPVALETVTRRQPLRPPPYQDDI